MKSGHCIALEAKVETAKDAILLAAAELERTGLVGSRFAEDCMAREQEFPTGLCTAIPVAIPHCNSKSIIQTGICYLRLQQPVEFRRMDDEEESIYTKHIFVLAIKEAKEHVLFLQKMIRMLTTEEAMKELEQCHIDRAGQLLENRLWGE